MPKLLVVATPIGNLGDLSPRMREALEQADLILAEDTRVTMKLLNHFGLKKPMLSCHRHNEFARAHDMINRMISEDLTVALTCDAGTPSISDPGHLIVKAAWEAKIPVSPVVGPSAVAAALSCAGFDARVFAFYGFLPREKKALREKLSEMRTTGIPVLVFYESPHRVVALVEEIACAWPEADLCACADLTKKFEWIVRGSAQDVLAALRGNPSVEKGEYALVADLSRMPPAPAQACDKPDALSFLFTRIALGDSLHSACDAAAAQGYARNAVYKAKLQLRDFLNPALLS